MELEDMRFIVNIPFDYRLVIRDDEEDDNIIASNISQEILEYLTAKIESMGGNIKTIYSPDISQIYKDACELGANLFISSRVIAKPEKEYNWSAVQFFMEDTGTSLGIASCLVNRLDKMKCDFQENTPLFTKSLSKEESCGMKRSDSIPSMILALCLGYTGLSDYNADKDSFLNQLVDSMLYSITDNLCSESIYDIDLREYAD